MDRQNRKKCSPNRAETAVLLLPNPGKQRMVSKLINKQQTSREQHGGASSSLDLYSLVALVRHWHPVEVWYAKSKWCKSRKSCSRLFLSQLCSYIWNINSPLWSYNGPTEFWKEHYSHVTKSLIGQSSALSWSSSIIWTFSMWSIN